MATPVDLANLALNLVPGRRVEFNGTFFDHGDFKAFAYRAANLTTSGANQKVAMDTVIWDPAKRFDLTNGWFVAPVKGIYLVTVAANIGSGSPNWTQGVSVSSDGTIAATRYGCVGIVGNIVNSTIPVLANQGDKILFFINLSASQTVAGGIDRTYMMVQLIGAQ